MPPAVAMSTRSRRRSQAAPPRHHVHQRGPGRGGSPGDRRRRRRLRPDQRRVARGVRVRHDAPSRRCLRRQRRLLRPDRRLRRVLRPGRGARVRPELASLTGEGLSGAAYVVEDASDDQPTVFSTEPGRDDYTPAWSLHRVTWSGEPRVVRSEAEILDAERSGDLTIERTNIVFNGGMVKWSSGEMAVDDERTDYLGKGQLLEPVDTTALTATFKLSQCFPASPLLRAGPLDGTDGRHDPHPLLPAPAGRAVTGRRHRPHERVPERRVRLPVGSLAMTR